MSGGVKVLFHLRGRSDPVQVDAVYAHMRDGCLVYTPQDRPCDRHIIPVGNLQGEIVITEPKLPVSGRPET